MAKVIMTCGRICCGKSTYARKLQENRNAVVLSIDDITLTLFPEGAGEMHDVYVRRAEQYLLALSLQILETGADVILDWGFWQKADRTETGTYFADQAISFEWYYLDISDARWRENIARRNAAPGPSDYFADEGLLQKCVRRFEAPDAEEARNWHIIR